MTSRRLIQLRQNMTVHQEFNHQYALIFLSSCFDIHFLPSFCSTFESSLEADRCSTNVFHGIAFTYSLLSFKKSTFKLTKMGKHKLMIIFPQKTRKQYNSFAKVLVCSLPHAMNCNQCLFTLICILVPNSALSVASFLS